MYYVTSNGDAPLRVFISFHQATQTNHDYIDVFNSDGYHIAAYKLVSGEYVGGF